MMTVFRFALILSIAALCMGLYAQPADDLHWWGSYNTPGNFILDINTSYDSGASPFDNTNTGDTMAVWTTAEFLVSKIFINNTTPLDIGLHATGLAGFNASTFEDNVLGAGGGITAHIGFRGFGGRFGDILERIDVYSNLGVGYTFMFSDNNVKSWTGFDDIPIALHSTVCIAYYLNDNSAITFGNSNWGLHSGLSLGFRIKSGPKQTLGKRPEPQETKKPIAIAKAAAEEMEYSTKPDDTEDAVIYEQLSKGEAEFYLQLFRSLYGGVFSHGGFLIDDYNYIEGEGTIFKVEIHDEEKNTYREVEIRKALLARDMETSTWSYTLELEDEGRIIYEFTLDGKDLLQNLAVIQGNNISTYIPDYPMEWNNAIVLFKDDFEQYTIASERRNITSGTFLCNRLFYDAGEYKYTWWVSDDIPGYLIDFSVERDGHELIRGNLKEISLKNTSIIGD